MPTNFNRSIERLRKRLQALKREQVSLAAKQTRLATRHHVLGSCCDFLNWLRTRAVHAGWTGTRVAPTDSEMRLLLKLQRVGVPQELLFSASAPSARGGLVLGLADTPAARPLAAHGDFLGPMREVLALPPPAGARTMSLAAAAAKYGAVVQALCSEEDPARQRLLHLHIIALTAALGVLHADTSMLARFQLLNVHTRQVETESDAARCARADSIVAALALTPEQRALVLGCHDVFAQLSDAMRGLLGAGVAELLALTSEASSVNSDSSTAERNVAGQQAASERLALLLRKERLLRVCWAAYVASMCNVDQLSRAALAAWPFPLDLTTVGASLQAASPGAGAAAAVTRSGAAQSAGSA